VRKSIDVLHFLQFLARRLIAIPITIIVVTLILYGVAALAPPEVRAKLYWPRNVSEEWMALNKPEEVQLLNQRIIEQYGLDDPFPVQYIRWLSKLLQGDWGSSLAVNDVLAALLQRTPATVELTLYSVLLLIPLGLASGVTAGWRKDRLSDHGFRFLAFVATSTPPFILALILLTAFYVGLHWFPPGRLSARMTAMSSFKNYTGLLTVDGLLNGRVDMSLDAVRHLVLPVITLSLAHWATLGRVTRAAMIEELGQQYVTAARSRGLSMREVVWRHAFRNAILPGLNSSAVSVATLVTGVFVVETVFDLHGVSELIVVAVAQLDLPLTLGFTVYSVLVVLPLMLVLDVLQAVVDPRIREGGV
jgi:ABC-type dipeptide/oligopeptide/nickel transport system permease component